MLQQKLSASTERIAQLEREISESEEKNKKYFSSQARNGMRESEDRFLREERLRDELDVLRRTKLGLEASLLERDSQALEQRFNVEAAQVDVERLRRRVSELEQVNRALRNITTSGSHVGASAAPLTNAFATAGDSLAQSRREIELESVVDSLRRVVEKLRAENDRLRKDNSREGEVNEKRARPDSTSATNVPMSTDKDKKALQVEKKKNERLLAELSTAHSKIKQLDELQAKFSSRAQQLSSLRQSLKIKEEELSRALQDMEVLRQKVANLERNDGGINEHEKRLDVLRKQLSVSTTENDRLRADMSELQRKLQSSLSTSSSVGDTHAMQQELTRLHDENEKLKQELSAFDLDFFEEIENLKFAHAQALRKLKLYEQQR
jgi:DNA repair exonuclease SbcCD ATPase subunit